jgi:hypothetical protein
MALNERGDQNNCIDGDLSTFSYLTPSGTETPNIVAFDFGGPQKVNRIRVAKDGDVDWLVAPVVARKRQRRTKKGREPSAPCPEAPVHRNSRPDCGDPSCRRATACIQPMPGQALRVWVRRACSAWLAFKGFLDFDTKAIPECEQD